MCNFPRRPVTWALALVATASVALAQGVPSTTPLGHSDILDAAEMFSPEAIQKAETALAGIQRDTRVATVIETIESLEGEKVDEVAQGRARQSGARGIYILIAKNESKIQVLVSKEFTGAVIELQRVLIRQAFVEDFKKRDFNAGLERAVEKIGEVLGKAKAAGKFAGLTEGPGQGDGQASPSPLVVRDQVRLNLAGARRIIAGAEAKASALGIKVNIAVVDDGGHMLGFARMDGARPASGYTATTKAVTAATFRQATGPIPPGSSSPDVLLNLSLQNAAAASGGKLTTLYGGVPAVVDGQTIGAVGVGGGTGEQDAVVARGGIDAFLAELRAKPEAEPTKTGEIKVESTTNEIKIDPSPANYTEAIKFDPGNALAYCFRAVAAYMGGRPREALADYTQAIRLKPDLDMAYVARGRIYYETGDLTRALADYDEAIRLKPGNPIILGARGRIYADMGQYDRALADYTEVIRLKPESAEARYRRGQIRYLSGDNAGAVVDFSDAIRLDPAYAWAYRHRGDAFARLGNRARADADRAMVERLARRSARPVEHRESIREDRPK